MADSKFWLFQRAKFNAIEGQLGHLLDRPDRDRWLIKGHCTYSDEPDTEFAHFAISGGLDASYQQDYTDMAAEAGKELECPAGTDPSKYWQHRLCQDLVSAREPELRKQVQRRGRLGGIIIDLVGSSASYCQRLASRLDSNPRDARLKRADQVSPGRRSTSGGTRRYAVKASAGEKKRQPKDLLDRLSRNPKHKAIRRLLLEAWGDSHGLVAEALTGQGSLSGYVKGCVKTFAQGAKIHVAIEDGTSISVRCRALEGLARKVIRRFNISLAPESRRLGKTEVADAKAAFSLRVHEITARSKQTMIKAELASDKARHTSGAKRTVAHKSRHKVNSARRGTKPRTSRFPLDAANRVKQSRATTVAKLIKELDLLSPQMFDDESEYNRLRGLYPSFLTFEIAGKRPDLKQKVRSISGSPRHIRLAQELAAARYGRKLSTIQDDWKDYKPAKFKRKR